MAPRYQDQVAAAYTRVFHHDEAAPPVIVNAAEIGFALGDADYARAACCRQPARVVTEEDNDIGLKTGYSYRCLSAKGPLPSRPMYMLALESAHSRGTSRRRAGEHRYG